MTIRTIEQTALKIEKESIKDLSFSRKEVLLDIDSQLMRNHDLHRAQILGNLSQGKVSIWFETANQKLYRVDTTIWAVGSQFITLKGGTAIPINSIVKID
ncbi:hypothetical protein [Lunatibacter salilacus]|uniref:hypothetical protein n=1 Tax=Lunatibacter salilacus TaxID=2483804 RepID=UPI00131C4452|nr:hypothetical protein [Lunatibacter salilacus]